MSSHPRCPIPNSRTIACREPEKSAKIGRDRDSQKLPSDVGSRSVGPACDAWSALIVSMSGGPVTQPSNPVSPPGGQVSTPAQDATVLERALFEVKRVIVGQDRMIERMFVSLLSRGHVLLEGVPGVAKTLAVETLARVVG